LANADDWIDQHHRDTNTTNTILTLVQLLILVPELFINAQSCTTLAPPLQHFYISTSSEKTSILNTVVTDPSEM